MSFQETVIEPAVTQHPDTLVMYPYPMFANIQNTGSRLQALADKAGVHIIASDLYFQDKKTIFDMAAREANQPVGETYRSMSKRRAEYASEVAYQLGATTFVGMGDSLGVSAIQGMQLHGGEVFDGLLLRDGWNLDEDTTVLRGITRYARYQIKDAFHQWRDKVSFDILATSYDSASIEDSETNPFEKLTNVADIMRGSHNRDNAVRLAGESITPMNIVTLRNGLSAENITKITIFIKALRSARKQQHPFNKTEGLIAKIYPGWHSDLLDPKRGAEDLTRTLDLINK